VLKSVCMLWNVAEAAMREAGLVLGRGAESVCWLESVTEAARGWSGTRAGLECCWECVLAGVLLKRREAGPLLGREAGVLLSAESVCWLECC
jgi:hypothetical protein